MAIASSNKKIRRGSYLSVLRARFSAARSTAKATAAAPRSPWPILAAMATSMVVGGFVMWEHDRGKEVVTAVNGDMLDKEALFDRLQTMSGASAVQQWTDEELMLQFGRSKHIFPTEAQVEARYAELRQNPDFQAGQKMSSVAAIKRGIRLSLVQMLLMGQNVTVTDEEIFRYYQIQSDKNNPKARYYRPETVTCQVIVTKTEAAANEALHALVSGLPFGAVAQTYSIDVSKQNMGVLPPIHRGQTRNLAPEFEEALFHMRVGSRIGPSHFYGRWWVIRCLDRNVGLHIPFSAVKEECRLSALAEKGAPQNTRRIQAEFGAFKRTAKYQAFWPTYSDAWKSN